MSGPAQSRKLLWLISRENLVLFLSAAANSVIAYMLLNSLIW